MLESKLLTIKGIGEKRLKLLFQHIKTLENIKNASEEELKNIGIPTNIIPEIKKL